MEIMELLQATVIRRLATMLCQPCLTRYLKLAQFIRAPPRCVSETGPLRAAYSSSPSCSGRAEGGAPTACSAAATCAFGRPSPALTALAAVLRRWLNAARMVRNMALSLCGATGGAACSERRSTALVTLSLIHI